MITGTAIAFIFTGVIGLVAIVSAIWLEQRVPDLQHPRIRVHPPGPAPASKPAALPPPGPAASISLGPAHPHGRH